MKICVVSTTVFACVPPNGTHGYAGLEVIAYHCARGLAEKGHQVALVAPEGSSCPGVTVIPTGPPGQWDEGRAYGGFKQRDAVGNEYAPYPGYWPHLMGFDAIIDHSWHKFSYMLKAEGRLKCPVLGVLHAPVDTMYKTLPPGVDNPCFVAISKDQAAHFEALFNRPARVCYNGIDLDYYRPLGVPRGDRFLFLARFSSIKGADLAIKACREAGVGLDLVGDTKLTGEAEYLESIRGMADGKQIRFLGPATRGETVWHYGRAHCMIHPNQRFREPFGLAPVEAQACGCPVIAWDNGAMRETVRYGDRPTGALVRDMAGLVGAVRSLGAGIGDACRAACREWASQFGLRQMTDRYESLCKEALEGGW